MAVVKQSALLVEIVWANGSVSGMNIGGLSREDTYDFELKFGDLSKGLVIELKHQELPGTPQELGAEVDDRGAKYVLRNDGFAFVVEPDWVDRISELYFQGELVLLRFKGELLNLLRLNSLSRIYLGTNTSLVNTISKLYPILEGEVIQESFELMDPDAIDDAVAQAMGLSKDILLSVMKTAGKLPAEEIEEEEIRTTEELQEEAYALGIFGDEEDAG